MHDIRNSFLILIASLNSWGIHKHRTLIAMSAAAMLNMAIGLAMSSLPNFCAESATMKADAMLPPV